MKPSRPTSPTAKRVGGIMHRKESTRWMPKEIKAFQLLEPIEEPDLASIERYYRMNWPPRHGKNPLRTDLITLLNNWPGELGRANQWNIEHPDKPKLRKIIQMAPIPSEPFIQTEEAKERTDKFMEEYRARKKPRTFQDVKDIMQG